MAESGWYVDPARRHEYRFHDGMVWTKHVADQGCATVDPLAELSGPPPPPGRSGQPASRSPDDSLKKLGKWADKHMQVAAGWVAQRGSTDRAPDTPVLDQQPSASVLGQWTGLVGAVQKYAIATSGITGGAELLGVLRAVSGSEDAQSRVLQSIDAKVDAIAKGPYNTGRTYLREAQRLGANDPGTHDHIERAKEAFYDAHGQAASVQSRSLVEYHLGLSWLLLDRRGDAVHWFAQSHASALAVIEELARCSQNVKVLRSQASTAAAAWLVYPGVVVLGMKFKKMVAAQRARQALVDMLPFVDCVARCHNSMAEAVSRLPALSLVSSGENAFELVPVAV
jgi:Protein of unknown function (DUF2510)